jgi:hypothetical protein
LVPCLRFQLGVNSPRQRRLWRRLRPLLQDFARSASIPRFQEQESACRGSL